MNTPKGPKVIVCQKNGQGIENLAKHLDEAGCAMVTASGVRDALQQSREGLPVAIFCEVIMDDGTATMLYDLVERDLPRPAPRIYVMAGPTKDLQMTHWRRFSGVILKHDSEGFGKIIKQIRSSPWESVAAVGPKDSS